MKSKYGRRVDKKLLESIDARQVQGKAELLPNLDNALPHQTLKQDST
jgi:hypothetical protein